MGGEAASLVAKLRELEAQQHPLAEEVSNLRPVPRLPHPVLENRLAEWRRLLRQSPTQVGRCGEADQARRREGEAQAGRRGEADQARHREGEDQAGHREENGQACHREEHGQARRREEEGQARRCEEEDRERSRAQLDRGDCDRRLSASSSKRQSFPPEHLRTGGRGCLGRGRHMNWKVRPRTSFFEDS